MTKRFSPKAGLYTSMLAETQRDIAKLKKNLATLEAKERSLKAFLMPFYENGDFDITQDGSKYRVSMSTTYRDYLNHDKAKAIIARAGYHVPYSTTEVVVFRVKKA